MCMFSDEIRVSDTSIFARRTAADKQVLVYSMKVYSDAPTAMILPLPVPPGAGDDALRFIDLSGYENYFTDMYAACDVTSNGAEEEIGGLVSFDDEPLAVHVVGDFDASFVPCLADFRRLDARFQLPDDVWADMPGYEDYGFAVFQLNSVESLFSGSKNIHPMAFEFSTRDSERLFFPTVHVHDGKFHPRANFDHALFMQFPDDTVACEKITAMYNQMHEKQESMQVVTGYDADRIHHFNGSSGTCGGQDFTDNTSWPPLAPAGSEEFVMLSPEYEAEAVSDPGKTVDFVFSYDHARFCMHVDRSVGTVSEDHFLFGLVAKGELRNQDVWV